MMIETKDLILAKAKLEDLDSIYNNYWRYEETAKYMLWTPCKNKDEAKDRLEKVIEYQKERLSFFVYEKNTGQAIGMAGLKEIEPTIYEDSGIGIGKDFVGHGYGKQILNALLDYVFSHNASKVICSCHTDNIASSSLQKSCGMHYTHSEIVTRKKDTLQYQSDYYEISKSEYQSLNSNKK